MRVANLYLSLTSCLQACCYQLKLYISVCLRTNHRHLREDAPCSEAESACLCFDIICRLFGSLRIVSRRGLFPKHNNSSVRDRVDLLSNELHAHHSGHALGYVVDIDLDWTLSRPETSTSWLTIHPNQDLASVRLHLLFDLFSGANCNKIPESSSS